MSFGMSNFTNNLAICFPPSRRESPSSLTGAPCGVIAVNRGVAFKGWGREKTEPDSRAGAVDSVGGRRRSGERRVVVGGKLVLVGVHRVDERGVVLLDDGALHL